MNRTLASIFAVMILLGIAIWYFANIFGYVLISIVLATILRPLTNRICHIKFLGGTIPRVLAILISFSVVVFVIASLILLFIPLVTEQIDVLSQMNYINVLDRLLSPINQFEQFFIKLGLTENEPGFLIKSIEDSIITFVKSINITSLLNTLISFTGSFFISMLAIIFITFFLLYENGIIRRQLIGLIPNAYFEVFIAALYKIERLLSNYLLGLLFQMFSIFSIAALALSALGVNYAITIAAFAAVANLIPYLGPLLGSIFGIIVGVSTSSSFALSGHLELIVFIEIFSVFAAVQTIDNLFLQPLIFSKSIKAHPLEIFVIIFVAATIAGIPGMILAIPVYTVIKVSFAEVYVGFNEYKVFKSKG